MAKTFVENVSYLESLNNTYGKTSELTKSNMYLVPGTTYNITTLVNIYNKSTSTTDTISITGIITSLTMSSHLSAITTEVQTKYPSVVVTSSYVPSGTLGAGSLSIVITTSDTNLYIRTTACELSIGTDIKYNIESVVTDAIEILPTIAMELNQSILDSMVVIKDNLSSINIDANNVNNINTIATNINNINAIAIDMSNINVLASDINNVNILSSDIAIINRVYTSISNIDTIAVDITNPTYSNILNAKTNADTAIIKATEASVSETNAANSLISIQAIKTALENGRIWYFFTTDPINTVGIDGDFAFNSTTHNVFKKTAGIWTLETSINSISSILRTSGDGSSGTTDTYTITYSNNSTSTFNVYNGAQGPQGLQGLQGPQGIQGIQGVQGIQGHSVLIGNTDPTTQGIDNDIYLNVITDDVFKKISGVWNLQGNIKGLQGPQGIQGIQGITGDIGAQGIQGPQGIQGISIDHVTKTAGTSAAGTIDTYTVYGDVASTINMGTFNVYNGADGTGIGDMLKSVYDTTNNGIVDNAETVNGLTVQTAVPTNALFTDTIYIHPTNDGNLHVPATSTTNAGKVLTAGSTAGSLMWETPSIGVTDHTLLSNIGTNTHAQIDTAMTRLASTSGTNTGDQASVIGNAGSATVLQTARTINGVSFDGSTNIVVNAVDSTPRIAVSEKGVANGVATLDSTGIIPTTQLPSYVDDVLEYVNLAGFPITGETGKIYVALDTNKTYRWSGTVYVYITSGAVDSVAGKIGVVTLVKADVGLELVDNTSDVNKPVSIATQTALDSKANLSSPAFTNVPTAPTAASGTNTTQLATTEFVHTAVGSGGGSYNYATSLKFN